MASTTLTISPGASKGAILLAALGKDLAARVLGFLPEEHVQAIAYEFSKLNYITSDQIHSVAQEFEEEMDKMAGSVVAGPDFARQTLEKAVGAEKATRILGGEQVEAEEEKPKLSSIIQKTSASALAAAIVDEHPQMIALLLDQIDPDRAAEVLAALPSEVQGLATARLARTETPSPIAILHLEQKLRDKLTGSLQRDDTAMPGPQRVADILGRMQRSHEAAVLNCLQEEAPDIAEEVSQYRFGIDQFVELDDRTIQRVIREVEHDKLVLVMKGLDQDRQERIVKNMSERAAARLTEDLENMGPARLRDVESAQRELVSAARRLEEEGEISLRTASGGVNDEEAFI